MNRGLRVAAMLVTLAAVTTGCEDLGWVRRVPCERLPELVLVKQVQRDHAEEIAKIESIAPGTISFEIDDARCPGKGELQILYGTVSQRRRIQQEFVRGHEFHAVPVVFVNI